MERTSTRATQTAPRRIVITIDHFGFANIEAWMNIIRSYKAVHPNHQVTLLYQGEPTKHVQYLFKLGRPVNRDGFELVVAAPADEQKDVAKLYRLLVEGAGADYQKFLDRELYRTLKLF